VNPNLITADCLHLSWYKIRLSWKSPTVKQRQRSGSWAIFVTDA